MRALAVLALLFFNACAATQPANRDERFVIFNHGDFTAREIQRVRAQLEAGAAAWRNMWARYPADDFPSS
jgi:hypothetical protein